MEKKEIEKIVKKQTMIHLPHIHPYTVMDFEKGLVEALHQALSMSGVVESVCDACHGFDARAGRLGIGHLGCHKCGK